RRLSTKLDFSIESFAFKGQGFRSDRTAYLITHDFSDSEERNERLVDFAAALDIDNASAIDQEKLPHFRFFEFKNDSIRVIIRPDGGIEHGWTTKNRVSYNSANTAHNLPILKRDGIPLLFTIAVEQL